MGNLLKVISQKRQNSNKKPKWNMRKLSIGLISCLLGFSMLISSTTNVYAKVAWGTDGKVYMGDTDAEVNNAKKNIDVTKTLSADGKSIHWKIEFNKNRESWTTPWIFVFLPDAVKAPKEIKRYKNGVYHDTVKIEDFNGSHNRWHAEKGTQGFEQEWTNFVQRTGNDGSMAEQNAWKDQGRYSRLIYSKEASGKTAYTWEFDTEIIPGIDVDEAAILAGINAWNHGYPRVVGYGPHDTDGDGVSDVKENKLGTDPTKADSKPSKDKVYPPVVNDGKKYVKKGTTVLSNEILDRVTVPREAGAITKETGSVPTELGEGTAKVKVKYSDGSEALADVPVVVYEAPVAPDKKTEVGDTEHLTAEEKKVVEDAIKAKNSKLPEGTTVTVDEKGKATITLPDGTTEEIPADKLVEKKKPKEKTATPTDVKQDYDDNTGKAVITGKAPANSEVKLKNSNGDVVATTTAKPDGTFSIPIPNTVKDGDKVTVTATETGKTESEKSNEVVIDLKDPSAPTIEDVYVGDKDVTVNLPNDVEVGDKVRVTLPDGKRVEVELTAEMIAAKKAKVGIPEGITLKKDEQVTVQLMDKAGNTSDVIVTKVKEKEFDKEKIAKIEIKTPPTKTKYIEGEKFDPAGMVVTLTDENGKKVDVPAEKFAEYGITVPTENLTKDQTKVEVKVRDKKAEQPITVKEKEFDKEKIAKIEIKTPPTKTKYTEGEKFDSAGMVVTLTDENGKKVDVPAEKFAEYGITVPTENLTKNQTKVEVKVKDKKAEQPITVTPKINKTEKPVINNAKAGDKKITGTAEPGATLTVTTPEGVKTVVANADGKWEVALGTPLAEGDIIRAIAKVNGKGASNESSVIVGKAKPIADQVTPAVPKEKTPVENPTNLTEKEKETVKKKLEEANKGNFPSGTKVEIGPDGTATITYPDNSQDKIKGRNLVVKKKVKPIADQVTPAIPKEKTPVENPTNLTEKEKETVKKKLEEANKGNFPSGTRIEIGSDGTATITYPDNSQDKIKGRNLVVKKKVKPIADQVTPAIPKEKTPVENPTNLAEKEKETVKKKLEEANKGNFPSGTRIEIGSDGTATITYPDNSQDKIKGSDLVVKKKVVSKKPTNKKLPKTSITGTGLSGVMIGLAGIGLSVLKKKKRED
ncbi:Ig-like domain-containing protein [Parvimonas micra]|uniref:Ig-like domain-containing protein n=1 Tax=Parvimonas micra TaxID=33033 RepID=UPI0022B6E9DC|nr:Ig-like domain-containing protein [Parvimonas micra]WBB33800.1 Ig-like domain-containing protein [Parvimonas micra]WBB35321.1 Ig-like domain-containing protein [Parvimonas micra]